MPAIDTFVVLMLENRSFDHMLGFLQSPSYPIEGLTGNETNPVDPHTPSGPAIRVSPTATLSGELQDPGHSLNPAVIRQLYGLSDQEIQRLTTYPPGTPLNNGFVYDYGLDAGAAAAPDIMKCFAAGALPALGGLAQQFAVCDHWFSSVPGPTLPNRWYVHCGTSVGYVGGALELTALNTIQQLLWMNGRTWKVYYGDFPHALTLMRLWQKPLIDNFVRFDRFAADAKAGSLPNYSFIEPSYFLFPNDQHPPHHVAAGEQLIAAVYAALRSSPQWQRSMLVITYDEHGGCYDHVPPPPTISPDGLTGYDDDNGKFLAFGLDRLGVRVPAVVVSPYVPKGTIVRQQHDHTSVLRTLEDAFGLPRLSRRDAAANSLLPIASLTTARGDAPPSIAAPPLAAEAAQSDAPLSDLQRELLQLARLLPVDETPRLQAAHAAAAVGNSERAAGAYVSAKLERWLASR